MPTTKALCASLAATALTFLYVLPAVPARAGANSTRLDAVRTFADRVLEHGRDTYRETPTPLFVDGVNVDTLEPVRWIHKGEAWIPSNLASQQNLLRTLVALSRLTDDPRYREAAAAALRHHIEHLRMDCGLFQWGGHRLIDLASGRPRGEGGMPHELKFLAWTVDGLRAWARHGYDPKTNIARPMWADGTDLTDHVIQRTGYYGQKGRVIRAGQAGPLLLWSYVLGYRLSGDEALWETARAIARGNGLSDLGTTPGQGMKLDLKTGNSDPVALFAVLELCRASDDPAYLALASRLGDNIVTQRFHNGFFLPSGSHKYANFNTVEPLALLALEATLRGEPDLVPRWNSGRGFFHCPHDGHGRTTDQSVLWNARRK
ncbi:MAG: hypothetical protein RBS80_00315 [Thermoguttaceae bacterium]|jgi:hypothetical protein|nr:hypothetical protein [Thermoguttaceae bacterium]